MLRNSPNSPRIPANPALAWVTIAAMLLTACGGAGGGGPAASAPLPASQSPPPSGTTAVGNVSVQVVDLLQAPVENARVRVIETGSNNSDTGVLTDAAGMAVLLNVPAGIDRAIEAWHASRGWNVYNVDVVAAGNVSQTITLIPNEDPDWVGAVMTADTGESQASPDGRYLWLRVSAIIASEDYPGSRRYGPFAGSPHDYKMQDCTPQAGNDLPSAHADCVRGAPGYDAAYRVVSVTQEATPYTGNDESDSFGLTLLLDQGDAVITADAGDQRLFATKYLLNLARSGDLVRPAAYAGDNPAPGSLSLLPSKPVYFLPDDYSSAIYMDPSWSLTGDIDRLALMEGGSSPLHSALDQSLSYTAAVMDRPGIGKTVVALVGGNELPCGAADPCSADRESLINRSKNLGVPLHLMVLDNEAAAGASPDIEALAELANRTGGSLWMLPGAPTILPAVSAMARHLHREGGRHVITVRLEADAGTFVSGRVVHGRLIYDNQEIREWGYDDLDFEMPFAVHIP